MPGFTISEFAGKLSTFGLASPNKFKVEFKGMPVGNTTDRQLDFMCALVNWKKKDYWINGTIWL